MSGSKSNSGIRIYNGTQEMFSAGMVSYTVLSLDFFYFLFAGAAKCHTNAVIILDWMVTNIVITLQIGAGSLELARTRHTLVNNVVVFHGPRGVQGLGGDRRFARGRAITRRGAE